MGLFNVCVVLLTKNTFLLILKNIDHYEHYEHYEHYKHYEHYIHYEHYEHYDYAGIDCIRLEYNGLEWNSLE